MKRSEILSRLRYEVPENKKIRLIVHSDVKNEADDVYSIAHHLLTPYIEVKGVIAAHFEGKYTFAKKMAKDNFTAIMSNIETAPQILEQMGIDPKMILMDKKSGTFDVVAIEGMIDKILEQYFGDGQGTTMIQSYEELSKLMSFMKIDDVPMLKGSVEALKNEEDIIESEGADFIIKEAMKEDQRPLYIALQGCLTDLAIALNKKPEIEDKIIAVWIGGGKYPQGGNEFNLQQDINAARRVFNSNVQIWQIPINVYKKFETSLGELSAKVRPCGEIGKYLFDQMVELNYKLAAHNADFPHGETWSLGDNPTVGVLLQSADRNSFHIQKAPFILDDGTYKENKDGKKIRVYDEVDVRLTLEDLFSKLKLCYGN